MKTNAHRWTIAALVVATLGFLRYLTSPMSDDWEFIHHVHGSVTFSWLLFLVVQPYLISRDKTAIHRLSGMIAIGFAGAVAVMLILAGLTQLDRVTESGGSVGMMRLSYIDVVTGAVFIGMVFRGVTHGDKEAHARWLLGTVLLLIGPAIRRLIFVVLYFIYGSVEAIPVDFRQAMLIATATVTAIGLILLARDFSNRREVYGGYLLPTLYVPLSRVFILAG